MKESMIIYESAYLAISYLPDDAMKWEAIEGLLRYGFYGEEPESENPFISMIYVQALPSMQNARERYERSVRNGGLGGRPTGAPIEEILAMKQQGMTNKQIAEKVGCSPKTIENRISYHKKKMHPQNPQNLSVSVSVSDTVSVSSSVSGGGLEEKREEREIRDLREEEGKEIVEKIRKRVKYTEIQQEYGLKDRITKEFPKLWEQELVRRNEIIKQQEIEANKSKYEFLQKFWELDSLDETRQRANVFLDKYPNWALDNVIMILQNHNELNIKTYNQTVEKTMVYDQFSQSFSAKPSILYTDWLNQKMCEVIN